MPQSFEGLGISFQYPDNWQLDDRDAVAGGNSVAVYSPGGAFWSVAVHPAYLAPGELSRAGLAAMREEYRDLDVESVSESVGEHELVGFDLNFYCLDLTNTALLRSVHTESGTYFILCQADDREFDEVDRVFRVITASLLS